MVSIGIAVLVGMTRIEDPYANFHNIFEGSTSNLHSLALGLVKTNFPSSGGKMLSMYLVKLEVQIRFAQSGKRGLSP
jgi:hypothetical protein